jgi:beta-glucosidase
MATLKTGDAKASDTSQPTPLYRDSGKSIDDRVSDLLSRMTVAEKAGQLFQDMIIMGPGGTLAGPSPDFGSDGTEEVLQHKLMTHFNLLGPITDAKSPPNGIILCNDTCWSEPD